MGGTHRRLRCRALVAHGAGLRRDVTLLQLIRDRRLTAFEHPVLREELAGLRWTERGGVLRPDHPASGHDDAVVAVALACRAALEAVENPGGLVYAEIL
ncbi:MAG TPA: hypothetical protein VGR25_11015 [bacterium]|nr:hypothetical protein [bacterium]